jgi:hypothetical protein
MSELTQIDAIINFVAKHPQTVASRRICREVLGESVERFNQEFASELETGLREADPVQINSYYSMVR